MKCKLAGKCKYVAKAVAKVNHLKYLGKKNAPQLYLAAGITGVVVGTGLACYATVKAKDKLEVMDKDVTELKALRAETTEEQYPEKEFKKDITIAYAMGVGNVAKGYVIPAVVMTASVASIMQSHKILNNRYLATVAAYKTLDESFNKYRARVKEEYGEEVDERFYYGKRLNEYKEKVIGDNGKKKTVKQSEEYITSPNDIVSPYAVVFDRHSTEFSELWHYNEARILSFEEGFNSKLQRDEYVFLNEVLDQFDIETHKAGQIVGWDKYSLTGDRYIKITIIRVKELGLENTDVLGMGPLQDDAIILDFNVDGPIFDTVFAPKAARMEQVREAKGMIN